MSCRQVVASWSPSLDFLFRTFQPIDVVLACVCQPLSLSLRDWEEEGGGIANVLFLSINETLILKCLLVEPDFHRKTFDKTCGWSSVCPSL